MLSKNSIMSIFLIEDDDVDAEQFERILTKNRGSYVLYRAMDGKEALNKIDHFIKTHAAEESWIVLDLKIPLVSGAEILSYIEQTYDLQETYIVIVSTSNDPRDLDLKNHPYVKAYIHKTNLSRDLPIILSQRL